MSSKARTVLCAAAVALGAVAAEGLAAGWRVMPLDRPGPPAVALPPLARVMSDDAGGQMWRQSGEVGGSVASARADVAMALGAQGWSLSKTIVMGRSPAGSELMVWTLRKRRILFMVWEKEAGLCGFAWGEEK